MKRKLLSFWILLKNAYLNWNRNEPWANSAVIAYYALFSLPSLLIIVVSTAGYFWGEAAIQGQITSQIAQLIGTDSAQAIEDMIANASIEQSSVITIIFGIGFLLFGATGVFFQLKMSLNNIWNVAAKKNTFLRMAINRAISLGMVLVLGLLLLVSLVISTILTAFAKELAELTPGFTVNMVGIVNFIISFLFITSLFAAIFKLLPDVKLRWKTTYLGAALTTILFLVGESLIGLYFGKTDPGSIYGGASAVVLILLWVYYTCLILFYGAEFTVQYALHKHEKVEPNEYAEPAIYQELERLEKKKGQVLDEKRIMDLLKSNKEKTD